jgi:hypothetical protein
MALVRACDCCGGTKEVTPSQLSPEGIQRNAEVGKLVAATNADLCKLCCITLTMTWGKLKDAAKNVAMPG